MHGHTVGSGFHTLDGFEHGTAGVFFTGVQGLGLTHAAGGVDTGTAGFVGEADVVGVRETVEELQIREVGALTVVEFHHHVLGGRGHDARGQHHQIHIQIEVHAQQGVLAADHHVVAGITDVGHVGLGHHQAQTVLHLLVEAFQDAGDGHVLVQHEGLHGVIGLVTDDVGHA